MSHKELSPVPVVEWSPSGVRAYLPESGKIVSGPSLSAIRGHLGGEVVVAMSRRTSFLRTTRLPDAPKHEVAKILALQVGQLFPVSATEAAVDFYLTDDRNVEGRLAVVAAVKSETLKALIDDLSDNGLTARAVVPAALGSSYLAKQSGRRECAIVEDVTEGLAIDIIAEGELRASRVVPMPSQAAIDSEVMRAFAVAKVPCGEVVTAGRFTYPEANAMLESAGLSTLAAAHLPLTLEPPDIVAKRAAEKLNRARRVAVILWAAVILLVAVVWDNRSRDMEVVTKGESKWKKEIANLRKTKDQANAKHSSLAKVNTALGLAFEPKQRLGDVAVLLNNLTPEGLWLTGLTLERGKLITIRGTGLTGEAVTKYLERLSTQTRFRDVKLAFANNGQIEKTNVVQFSISAHVVGNFPLDSEVLK